MGDILSVNIALQVGSQSESVTVTAEAALLESSSAATGQVVDSKRLESLPLPASNPIVTTMLAVNMTMLTSPTSTFTPDANNQVTNTAAVGTRQGQSVQAIDGMPSMQGSGTTGIVPPPEILQEVKVSTAPYDASLGHFTGATINMVTKSGTKNGLHGALVFWNTNTSLNALWICISRRCRSITPPPDRLPTIRFAASSLTSGSTGTAGPSAGRW